MDKNESEYLSELGFKFSCRHPHKAYSDIHLVVISNTIILLQPQLKADCFEGGLSSGFEYTKL